MIVGITFVAVSIIIGNYVIINGIVTACDKIKPGEKT